MIDESEAGRARRARRAGFGCAWMLLAALGCGGGGGDDGTDDDDPAVDAGPVADAASAVDGGPPPVDTATRIPGYLRPVPFDRLIFELDRVGTRGPTTTAEEQLLAGVATIVNKPGGVSVVVDDTLEAGGIWSFAALDALATESYDGQPDAATVHVMIVDGTYEPNENTLGLAWAHRHIVLFADRIETECAELAAVVSPTAAARACDQTWTSIWAHELGHVLGLVANGTPMEEPHQEPEGTAHCDDEGCLMWPTYDSSALLGHVRGRLEETTTTGLGFDDACLADLAAVRDAI